jgi:hypothetical protein
MRGLALKTQDYSAQVDALRAAGCERIFSEKRSGKSSWDRPEFTKLMRTLVPGDTIVVSALWSAVRHRACNRHNRTKHSFSVRNRTTSDTGFAILDEPPGYCLHDWTRTNVDGFRSQTVLVGDFVGLAPIR